MGFGKFDSSTIGHFEAMGPKTNAKKDDDDDIENVSKVSMYDYGCCRCIPCNSCGKCGNIMSTLFTLIFGIFWFLMGKCFNSTYVDEYKEYSDTLSEIITQWTDGDIKGEKNTGVATLNKSVQTTKQKCCCEKNILVQISSYCKNSGAMKKMKGACCCKPCEKNESTVSESPLIQSQQPNDESINLAVEPQNTEPLKDNVNMDHKHSDKNDTRVVLTTAQRMSQEIPVRQDVSSETKTEQDNFIIVISECTNAFTKILESYKYTDDKMKRDMCNIRINIIRNLIRSYLYDIFKLVSNGVYDPEFFIKQMGDLGIQWKGIGGSPTRHNIHKINIKHISQLIEGEGDLLTTEDKTRLQSSEQIGLKLSKLLPIIIHMQTVPSDYDISHLITDVIDKNLLAVKKEEIHSKLRAYIRDHKQSIIAKLMDETRLKSKIIANRYKCRAISNFLIMMSPVLAQLGFAVSLIYVLRN